MTWKLFVTSLIKVSSAMINTISFVEINTMTLQLTRAQQNPTTAIRMSMLGLTSCRIWAHNKQHDGCTDRHKHKDSREIKIHPNVDRTELSSQIIASAFQMFYLHVQKTPTKYYVPFTSGEEQSCRT